MVSQGVLQQLEADGWYLKSEALESLAQELAADEHDDDPSAALNDRAVAAEPSHAELRAALLGCDYRKYGSGCLPDDVNRAHSSSIKGPLVLQVMSVTDVSKPSYGSGSGPNRLLVIKLSDGRISCKAMEHKHCSNLDDTLLPGTKVVLDQASVKLGVVQLEPRSLRVLGGRVDSLAEAYEAQRMYGGMNRPGLAAASGSAAGPGVGPAAPGEAAAARLTSGASTSAAVTADDGASAPKFKPFVVGRDDNRRSAAAGSSSRGRASAAAGNASAVKPGTAVAAGTSAAIAAAAVGAAIKPPDEKHAKRSVDVAPAQLLDAQTARQQTAAQAKLLDKLERSQAEAANGRGRGRGGFRGRRGRRGRHDSDDEGGGGMTLEEYEAKQKGGKVTLNLGKPVTAGSNSTAAGAAATADAEQMSRDEELARQLQAQMDLEEVGLYQQQQHLGQQQYTGQPQGHQQQQQRSYRQDGYRGRGTAVQVPLQYEHSQHQQPQQQPPPVGVDYTEAMFDSFDYNAGRARGHIGRGGRSSHNDRGYQTRGRGSGTARGRDAGSARSRGGGRGNERGRY